MDANHREAGYLNFSVLMISPKPRGGTPFPNGRGNFLFCPLEGLILSGKLSGEFLYLRAFLRLSWYIIYDSLTKKHPLKSQEGSLAGVYKVFFK